MSTKWKLALLVGLTVSIVSFILSYGFPDLSNVGRILCLAVTAMVSTGVGYRLFLREPART